MTRKPPCAAPELGLLDKNRIELEQFTLNFKLVTPMYGGGVKAGEPDIDMPVRVSGIRGQLRFWWRLLARQQFQSSDSLRQEEFAVWGGVSASEPLASKVLLRVGSAGSAKTKAWAVYESNGRGGYKGIPTPEKWANAPYALFCAQGKQPGADGAPPSQLIEPGLSFDLTVGFERLSDSQRDLVLESLRWWSQFGGLGARTRRGLGAVKLEKVSVSNPQIEEKLLADITPELANAKGFELALVSASDERDGWTKAVKRLQEFRQGVGVGRYKKEGNRFGGSSRWPEPKAIRQLLDPSEQKPEVEYFPRAAFGLPIIFHFIKPGPADTSLNPVVAGEKLERMASPLILRPVWSGGKWHAGALLLPHQHLNHLKLDLSGRPVNYWPTDHPEDVASKVPPIQEHAGTDALSAFMNFFEGKRP